MSNERKALKIICLLYVILAVIYLVSGAFVIAGVGSIDVNATVEALGMTLTLQPWALFYGVFSILAGVFCFVYAAAGIRGCNAPRKIGPFRAMAWIALVVAVIDLVLNTALNSGVNAASTPSYFSFAFAVTCIYLSGKVAEQAEK